jgi:hypothetical protein
MNLEWIAEDFADTIGHASKLKVGNVVSHSPLHAFTNFDFSVASKFGYSREFQNTNMVLAGESISYSTFNGVGTNGTITNALYDRLKSKTISGKINLVYVRIPQSFDVGNNTLAVQRVSELQASGIVGAQIEADANLIMPPLHAGISSLDEFEKVYERTEVEIQTSNKDREIVGFVPTTNDLVLVSDMVKRYVKDGVRFFAVDFSSSPLNRALIRSVVTAIRVNLKIKGKVGENTEKQYYLHVFNVTPNRKSPLPVAPITDVLTHTYGVDSTSGVMWGGGKMLTEKLRYFNMNDYGAYQIGCLNQHGITIDKNLTQGSTFEVYEKLRVNRNISYKRECENITQMFGGSISGYANHLMSKTRANKEVVGALSDVREIQARTV